MLTCYRIKREANVSKLPMQANATRKPERRAHFLSDQAARRTSVSRQRSEGSEGGNSLAVKLIPRRSLTGRRRSKNFGRGNSPAVMSIPQAIISSPRARQGIQKGELTRCQVNSPGERQSSKLAVRQGIQKEELTSCHTNCPGERQHSKLAAR